MFECAWMSASTPPSKLILVVHHHSGISGPQSHLFPALMRSALALIDVQMVIGVIIFGSLGWRAARRCVSGRRCEVAQRRPIWSHCVDAPTARVHVVDSSARQVQLLREQTLACEFKSKVVCCVCIYFCGSIVSWQLAFFSFIRLQFNTLSGILGCVQTSCESDSHRLPCQIQFLLLRVYTDFSKCPNRVWFCSDYAVISLWLRHLLWSMTSGLA